MPKNNHSPADTIINYAIQQEAHIYTALNNAKSHQHKPINGLIIGGGNRGHHYADYLRKHGMRIFGIVDPDDAARAYFGERFNIPLHRRFENVFDTLTIKEEIDAAVIATPDGTHLPPSLFSLKQGWHTLIEKPTTDTIQEYETLISTLKELNALRLKQQLSPLIATTCHVLEYSPYYRVLEGIVKFGELGRIYHIKHTEAVGFQHFISSYIRGPWRNTDETTAKLSHDYSLTHRLIIENGYARRPIKIKTTAYNRVFNRRPHFEYLDQIKSIQSNTRDCDNCLSNTVCPASATEIYGYTQPFPDTLNAIANSPPQQAHLEMITQAGGARISDTSVRHALPYNKLNRTFLEAPTVIQGYHDVIKLLKKAIPTQGLNHCAYLEIQSPKDTHISEITYDNDLTIQIDMQTATNYVSTRTTLIEAENGCATISQDKDKEKFTIQYFHPAKKDITRQLSEATSINMNDGHGGADEGLCMSFLAAIINQDPGLVQQLDAGREAYKIMSYAMRSKSEKKTLYINEVIGKPDNKQAVQT